MDVLVVSPNTDDLPLSSRERDAIVNLLKAQQLSGASATIAQLIDTLADQSFDLIWFIGHGRVEGITLHNKELLTPDMLSTALRGTDTRLIFINTCDSETAGLRLYAATDIPIICSIKAIGDTVAYGLARRFAGLLAEGRSVQSAYRLVRNDDFRLIPDSALYANNESSRVSGLVEELVDIVSRHDSTLEEHKRLHALQADRQKESSARVDKLLITVEHLADQMQSLLEASRMQNEQIDKIQKITDLQTEHIASNTQSSIDSQRIVIGLIVLMTAIAILSGINVILG